MNLLRHLLVCAALAVVAPAGWAQLRTATVSVSRSVAVTPDQATFSVSVQGGPDLTLDQAVAALSNLSLTAQDLISVTAGANTTQGVVTGTPIGVVTGTATPRVQYNFLLSTPARQLVPTLSSLQSLGTTLPQQNSSLRFAYQLGGLQSSPARIDEARQKVLADLIADARRRASLVAAAAGLSLGSIRSLVEVSSPSLASLGFAALTIPSISFGNVTSVAATSPSTSAQQVTFTLNVTYDLQ